jgi:hypothetical protein
MGKDKLSSAIRKVIALRFQRVAGQAKSVKR